MLSSIGLCKVPGNCNLGKTKNSIGYFFHLLNNTGTNTSVDSLIHLLAVFIPGFCIIGFFLRRKGTIVRTISLATTVSISKRCSF